MKLREFRPDDAVAICRWVNSENALYEWSANRIGKYPFTADDLTAHHLTAMKNERFMPFTFVDNTDEPIGHIAIRYPEENDNSAIRFGFVIIDPEFRRRGMATEMLDAACVYAASVLNAETASVSVFTANEKAVKCYYSAGFRWNGEAEKYELPIGEREGIIMEKSLVPYSTRSKAPGVCYMNDCDAYGQYRLNKRNNISRELLNDVRSFLDREWIDLSGFDRFDDESRNASGVAYSAPDMDGSVRSAQYHDENDLWAETDFAKEKTATRRRPTLRERIFSEGSRKPGKSQKQSPEEYEDLPYLSSNEIRYESSSCNDDLLAAETPVQYANRIEDIFAGLGQTFQEKLLSIIDSKGMTDAQVYTKANLDRRLFSKIRCNINYKPSKATVLALAIALGLNLDETTDLLGRAGLALSPSSKADLIVKYCIINKIHDILDVNAILYEYDQPLLGC